MKTERLSPESSTSASGVLQTLRAWVDCEAVPESNVDKVAWLRVLPFLLMHVACLGVFWTGTSTSAVVVAVGLYLIRMFAITGFYHRYFSHRSFKTSRFFQFFMAVLGATSVQRGALWWAAHHRHHHKFSDEPEDRHSRLHHGFLWSHVGWFTSPKNFRTQKQWIPDLCRFPELRFLDRYDIVVPALFATALYGTGAVLETLAPDLGTNGPQMLVWGFFISTAALFHGTFTINSLAHDFGRRRYATKDTSRNSLLLSLLTLGEGWHNNHHHYPHAARQGFFWWEIDITWYLLKLLAAVGIIWDLKDVPEGARSSGLENGA